MKRKVLRKCTAFYLEKSSTSLSLSQRSCLVSFVCASCHVSAAAVQQQQTQHVYPSVQQHAVLLMERLRKAFSPEELAENPEMLNYSPFTIAIATKKTVRNYILQTSPV